MQDRMEKIMKCKLLTSFLFAAALIALGSTAVASTTWYVNGVNGSDSNNCLSPTTACKTIGHAISLAAAGDSIRVAAATYAENLTIGISLTVTGTGGGTIIDGGGVGNAVSLGTNAVVSLAKMTIRNGFSKCGGAGILNTGTLTLDSVTIRGNTIRGPYGLCRGFGAGILNNQTLTINNSTVTGNTAYDANYGTAGGGIMNRGTLIINNSTISKNKASGGANGYTSIGGGLYNSNLNGGGTVTISNTTLNGNGSTSGGGIYNEGTITVSNTTMSGNQASSGAGIYIVTGRTTTLQNTIVATNTRENCAGTITSNGYNLSSDGTCKFSNTGDLNNTDPMLGPLQNNGGPTKTMALSSGSPAIDAGNPNGCTDGQGHLLKTDQRGKPRPDAEDTGGCDMGAYESQSAANGPVLTGYCAAPSYPRCAEKLDLIHCPPGQPARGVLSNECSKYSAWSICDSGGEAGKCVVQ